MVLSGVGKPFILFTYYIYLYLSSHPSFLEKTRNFYKNLNYTNICFLNHGVYGNVEPWLHSMASKLYEWLRIYFFHCSPVHRKDYIECFYVYSVLCVCSLLPYTAQ